MKLRSPGFHVVRQNKVAIRYKQFQREADLRFELTIDNCLLVEAKSVENVLPIHKAQLPGYMKLLDMPLGLIINLQALKLTNGVSRSILPGANLK